MRRAEEDDIDLVQVVRLAEAHLRVALEPAVHLREAVAGIRRAVDEHQLHLRVVHQQADQFAGRVSGASDDSGAYHFLLRFWTL